MMEEFLEEQNCVARLWLCNG